MSSFIKGFKTYFNCIKVRGKTIHRFAYKFRPLYNKNVVCSQTKQNWVINHMIPPLFTTTWLSVSHPPEFLQNFLQKFCRYSATFLQKLCRISAEMFFIRKVAEIYLQKFCRFVSEQNFSRMFSAEFLQKFCRSSEQNFSRMFSAEIL